MDGICYLGGSWSREMESDNCVRASNGNNGTMTIVVS